MKRYFFIAIILLIVAAGIYGFYLYNKKPLDTHEAEPDYQVSAVELVRDFNVKEKAASIRFVDKIVVVTGVVKEIERTSLTLFLDGADPLSAVSCNFYVTDSSQLSQVRPGDRIAVKGKCTGKLIDVVLNNCTLHSLKEN
jgi:hypothetical protein